MFDQSKQREATRSIFMSSIEGLANTGAVAVTFLTTPQVFSATNNWIRAYTAYHYGPEFTDIVGFAWFVIVAFFVFFIARASFSTMLVMGGLAIAVRFL